MNYLDLLRELRADLAPPHSSELLPARRGLLRAIQGVPAASSGSVPRGLGRGVWRLAAPAGLAMSLAALLAVGAFGHDPRGVPVKPGSGATVVAEAPTAESDAARLLRTAALTAEHRQLPAVRPDQFVFVESVEAYPVESFTCDGKAEQSDCATIREPARRYLRRVWLSAGGVGPGLLRERPTAGASGWSETPLADCAMPGADSSCRYRPAYLGDLPTDPDAMLAYLTRGEPAEMSPGNGVFDRAGDLIGKTICLPRR